MIEPAKRVSQPGQKTLSFANSDMRIREGNKEEGGQSQ